MAPWVVLDRDWSAYHNDRMKWNNLERERVQAAPLLHGVPETLCDRLLADGTRIGLSRGETLFHQGEPAERFFIVLDGGVRLYRLAADGGECLVGLFSTGDSFAEAVALSGGCYPVAAEATASSTLLAITAGDFRRLLLEEPELGLRIISGLSLRLHTLVMRLEQQTTRSTTERVAAFLITLCPRLDTSVVVRLPCSKQLLAQRLGMQPESLSRALARLRERGVEVDGAEVRIDDPQRLGKG